VSGLSTGPESRMCPSGNSDERERGRHVDPRLKFKGWCDELHSRGGLGPDLNWQLT